MQQAFRPQLLKGKGGGRGVRRRKGRETTWIRGTVGKGSTAEDCEKTVIKRVDE
jgi:hypothetical protein